MRSKSGKTIPTTKIQKQRKTDQSVPGEIVEAAISTYVENTHNTEKKAQINIRISKNEPILHRQCMNSSCLNIATYARLYHESEYCIQHATRHCIDVTNISRTCIVPNCKNAAEYNYNFLSYPLYCENHAADCVEVEKIDIDHSNITRKIYAKLHQLREEYNKNKKHDISELSCEHTNQLIKALTNNIPAMARLKEIQRIETKDNPKKYLSLIDIDTIRYPVDFITDSDYSNGIYTSPSIQEFEIAMIQLNNALPYQRNDSEIIGCRIIQSKPEPIDEEWYNGLFK